MNDASYTEAYIKAAWMILDGGEVTDRYQSYSIYLTHLINTCQFSVQNLVISLYFLHKYSLNEVNNIDGSSMNIYLVLTSLILANKTYDDQLYTLKTWNNICAGIDKSTRNAHSANVLVNFKVLRDLETHFLSCLSYNLSYTQIELDDAFWSVMAILGADWRLKFHRAVCSPENAASTNSSCMSEPVQTASRKHRLVNMTPPITSSTSTPSSILVISPMVTPVNAFSPSTPITPYSEPHGFKRRRFYTHHALQHQARPANLMNVPYGIPGQYMPMQLSGPFTFQHKPCLEHRS